MANLAQISTQVKYEVFRVHPLHPHSPTYDHTQTNYITAFFSRAPAAAQAQALTEVAIEHLAVTTGIDPLQLRMDNLLAEGDQIYFFPGASPYTGTNPLIDMVATLRASSDYDNRVAAVNAFNAVS